MAKLTRKQLEHIQRVHATQKPRDIANELGVRVVDVRHAIEKIAKSGNMGGVKAAYVSKPPGLVQKIAAAINRRVVGVVLLAALCGLAAYVTMRPIGNSDFGWHAALGRYIVENRTVPTTEPLSHTAFGKPMVAHEWLSQAIYHLVIDNFGVLGLRWTHAGVAVFMLVWLYVLMRKQKVSPVLALFGVYFFFAIVSGRFQHRPHLFHMAALMVMYGYVFISKPSLRTGQLVLIFVGTVVWINAHSGAVLFATLAWIYFVIEMVQQKVFGARPSKDELGKGELNRLLVLAVLVTVALFVTPNHFRLIPYLAESQAINKASSDEWQSIATKWRYEALFYAVRAYWVLLPVTLVVALLLIRRVRLATLALPVAIALLPLSSVRFISASFAPLLLIIPWLDGRFGRWAEDDSRRSFPISRSVATFATLAIALGSVYWVAYPEVKKFKKRLSQEWNFQLARFPIYSMDFLDAVDLEGKIFNPPDWGGYLLHRTYTKYPAFIDGRWITYGEDVFKDSLHIQRRRSRAFEKLDDYDIDIIVTYREFIKNNPTDRERWIPVFENYNSGVYLRNDENNTENLLRCADYYAELGIPFSMETGFDERAAFVSDREWADNVYIWRRHLKKGSKKMIAGW